MSRGRAARRGWPAPALFGPPPGAWFQVPGSRFQVQPAAPPHPPAVRLSLQYVSLLRPPATESSAPGAELIDKLEWKQVSPTSSVLLVAVTRLIQHAPRAAPPRPAAAGPFPLREIGIFLLE